ncbi:hypothetical protein Tfu_1804 [Thermobifida fusca YX]|nr:hypothetical protein Tfu_1804 [Thermobifida fusca YX]
MKGCSASGCIETTSFMDLWSPPDLNYLEAALRGRVPDVHLNVATPPEQADTQLTAKLTVYIRAYLTQRSKHAD